MFPLNVPYVEEQIVIYTLETIDFGTSPDHTSTIILWNETVKRIL